MSVSPPVINIPLGVPPPPWTSSPVATRSTTSEKTYLSLYGSIYCSTTASSEANEPKTKEDLSLYGATPCAQVDFSQGPSLWTQKDSGSNGANQIHRPSLNHAPTTDPRRMPKTFRGHSASGFQNGRHFTSFIEDHSKNGQIFNKCHEPECVQIDGYDNVNTIQQQKTTQTYQSFQPFKYLVFFTCKMSFHRS